MKCEKKYMLFPVFDAHQPKSLRTRPFSFCKFRLQLFSVGILKISFQFSKTEGIFSMQLFIYRAQQLKIRSSEKSDSNYKQQIT